MLFTEMGLISIAREDAITLEMALYHVTHAVSIVNVYP